jgi:16S rRNA (guanine527-N7)-methyltransferase
MDTSELLIHGLQAIGCPCSQEQVGAFMLLLSELRKWNRTYNLTALKTDEDIIIKHILDSLLFLKALPHTALRLADAGSGAGFPGIPLKIARPELDITLIDSSRKKTVFSRHIIRLLKLADIHVLEQRLEHLGKENEKCFDLIVSRATFTITDFIKRACPYVNEQGILILNKGPKVSEEVKAFEEAPSIGMIKDIVRLTLPFIKAERNLIVLSCTM